MKRKFSICLTVLMLALCFGSAWAYRLEAMRGWANTKTYNVLSHDILRRTSSKLEFPLVSVETNMLDSLVLIVADGADEELQAEAAAMVRELTREEGMARVLDARGSDDVQIVFAHSEDDNEDYYDKMVIWGSKRGTSRGSEYTILYLEGKIPVANLQLNSTIFPKF